jgi:hypothetical protein
VQVLFHTGPAYLFDLMAVVTRRKPIMVKISQKMHKATRVRVQPLTIMKKLRGGGQSRRLYLKGPRHKANVIFIDMQRKVYV